MQNQNKKKIYLNHFKQDCANFEKRLNNIFQIDKNQETSFEIRFKKSELIA